MNYISKKTILFVTAAASLLLTGCVKEVFPSNGTLTDDQVKDYPVSMQIDGIEIQQDSILHTETRQISVSRQSISGQNTCLRT